MGRLFWKIFLWFWVTLILIVASVMWGTAIYVHDADETRRPNFRNKIVKQQVLAVSQVLKYGGEQAALEVLTKGQGGPLRIRVFVIKPDGTELLGRAVDTNDPMYRQYASVQAPNGQTYQLASVQNNRSRRSTAAQIMRPFRNTPEILFVWLGIAVLLSGLVCFWLAWYLARPIRSLQMAAQKLSHGELDTRVRNLMGNRRDEIADLGQDFDLMASRLQAVITSQKQLLSDVSHELRSPLARLHVALGLARNKSRGDIETELTRIEQEANRLDELVGGVLTLSRLEAGLNHSTTYAKEDYVDVASLLSEIVKDANYEANTVKKQVVLNYKQSWILKANTELLRRALENIIRNAIHYTKTDTTVTVLLAPDKMDDQMIVTVCDSGPGVPEEKIDDLFKPFARLSEARDRDSGGYGLGLAIAQRAVRLHSGTISAGNNGQGGLCVTVKLPHIQ